MKEITVAFLQYSSWPLVAILIFFFFRSEIGEFLSRLRGLKAGKVELQLAQQIRNQGFTKEQLSAISSLTADDINIFLLATFTENPSFKYDTGIPYARFKECLLKIQDAGLILIAEIDDSQSKILHTQTSSGRRVRDMLVNSSVELLRFVAAA